MEAPIDELLADWLAFVDDYARRYPTDPALAHGIARLANHVLGEAMHGKTVHGTPMHGTPVRGTPVRGHQIHDAPQSCASERNHRRHVHHAPAAPFPADRRTLATSLAQVVELGEPSLRVALADHARALRRIV